MLPNNRPTIDPVITPLPWHCTSYSYQPTGIACVCMCFSLSLRNTWCETSKWNIQRVRVYRLFHRVVRALRYTSNNNKFNVQVLQRFFFFFIKHLLNFIRGSFELYKYLRYLRILCFSDYFFLFQVCFKLHLQSLDSRYTVFKIFSWHFACNCFQVHVAKQTFIVLMKMA